MNLGVHVLKMGQCDVAGPEVYWMSHWNEWVTTFSGGQVAARTPGGAVPYRKVYVCAKAFDATPALEPLPDALAAVAGAHDVSRVLNRLATAAASRSWLMML